MSEAVTPVTTRLPRLLVAGALVAMIWLVVLPWLAAQPYERARWEQLQQDRIDPSAMYYTELEAMEPILQRLYATGTGVELPK